ncbi:MAG: 4-hydroxythreonine-4-phosphate dehydrogenase PdxA [Ignavibacteriaceae bacterium]|jgi:4-hydroxythreonine-4-phosphate dehydrogenase|nr:4-hydroxythreonine-4-phosphate dehydrogenase PdxA [Ignavibacteriaceae bacterium]
MKRFIFTCGDINGIGPEIALKALNKITSKNKTTQFILIIPENVLKTTVRLVKPLFTYKIVDDIESNANQKYQVSILVTGSFKQRIGKPTVASGEAAFLALRTSFDLLKKNLADAVVTAPVSKTALKLAGVKYPGQTEMYADWCNVKNFVMTFLSKKLRVGLYSIHIPLQEVANSLNSNVLISKLETVMRMLNVDLGIKKPRVAVLGLNPHSGEGGIIGKEEKDIIEPIIKQKKFKSVVEGPFSSDAFFANRKFENYDMVFGLYHDQVLIPFKYINAGRGVNYSAGLPIIRTSPDHGTAYDIAGKGIADESSMVEAFKYAELILKNRKKKISIK